MTDEMKKVMELEDQDEGSLKAEIAGKMAYIATLSGNIRQRVRARGGMEAIIKEYDDMRREFDVAGLYIRALARKVGMDA